MNIFGKLAVSALALSVASVASAASISGSTDFRVTLPEILVLYHWDDAHLILTDVVTTPGNDSDAREISDSAAHDLSAQLGAGPYTLTGNLVTTATTNIGTLENLIKVTLQNSWAVRSLSTGNVTLGLTVQQPKLKNVSVPTSEIGVENAKLASGSLTAGTSLGIPSGFQPVSGDITFDLNLLNAKNSGEYNAHGAVGANTGMESNDTFLLTLTSAPVTP